MTMIDNKKILELIKKKGLDKFQDDILNELETSTSEIIKNKLKEYSNKNRLQGGGFGRLNRIVYARLLKTSERRFRSVRLLKHEGGKFGRIRIPSLNLGGRQNET